METIANRILFCLLLLLFGLPHNAFCQLEDLPEEEAPPPTKTRVTLQDMNSTPGMSFSVPVYFTPAYDVQVARMKLEMNFISENLKFVKLDRGIVADNLKLEMNTELKTEKNEKGLQTSTVIITASLPSASPPEEGISAGVLAYLVFRVDEKGRPANITLHVKGEATDRKTSKPVPNFEPTEARVEVFAPGDLPVVSCFFFTH